MDARGRRDARRGWNKDAVAGRRRWAHRRPLSPRRRRTGAGAGRGCRPSPQATKQRPGICEACGGCGCAGQQRLARTGRAGSWSPARAPPTAPLGRPAQRLPGGDAAAGVHGAAGLIDGGRGRGCAGRASGRPLPQLSRSMAAEEDRRGAPGAPAAALSLRSPNSTAGKWTMPARPACRRPAARAAALRAAADAGALWGDRSGARVMRPTRAVLGSLIYRRTGARLVVSAEGRGYARTGGMRHARKAG